MPYSDEHDYSPQLESQIRLDVVCELRRSDKIGNIKKNNKQSCLVVPSLNKIVIDTASQDDGT